GAHEHDVALPEVMADANELRLDLRLGDRVVVLLGREVQDHPRRVEPLQGQLVDRLRALASDGRVVVPRRVDVGRVVRAEARELLHRPALAVAQQSGRHAQQPLDLARALGVVGEPQVGAQQLGQLGRALLDRRGQVDDRHSREPTLPTMSLEGERARRVLDRVRAIPPGFVRTYGDVSPGSPRFAGSVLSAYHDPDVPWYRVVRADGTLARGAGLRRRLLREGVACRGERVVVRAARL